MIGRFAFGYRAQRLGDRLGSWIAWHLPRSIAKWCTVRLAAHATTGPWANQEVPRLTIMEMLQRWDDPR